MLVSFKKFFECLLQEVKKRKSFPPPAPIIDNTMGAMTYTTAYRATKNKAETRIVVEPEKTYSPKHPNTSPKPPHRTNPETGTNSNHKGTPVST